MYYRNHVYITQTGFQKLKNKLNNLHRERVTLGEELKKSQEPGNIEENETYQAVRNKTMQIDHNMQQIQETLQSAVLIKKPADTHMVKHGNTVKLKKDSDVKIFTVVGSLEADPSNGYISDESPVGSQLLNKKVGDQVAVGNGKVENYTIIAIQ